MKKKKTFILSYSIVVQINLLEEINLSHDYFLVGCDFINNTLMIQDISAYRSLYSRLSFLLNGHPQ